MQMRVDEINAKGGIAGRKIKLLAEDHGYDPKRAVLGTQKLVERDGIFLMVGQIGAATTNASMPVLLQKNVINFFPLHSGREAFEPPNRLKYAFLSPFYEQMRVAVPLLMKAKKASKPCALYQDDDFGLELLRGTEAGLKAEGLELTEKTTYKRGATVFSSQVARLSAAGCDLVMLGTVVRETVGAMTAARKINFNPVFVGSPGAYSSAIPQLGGKDVEGLYATMQVEQPYLDIGPADLRRFAAQYKAKFAEDATVFSSYGYVVIDLLALVLQKVGPDLNTDTFIKTLDAAVLPATYLGTPELSFGPFKRLGAIGSRLSQLQDGKWRVVPQ